MEQKKLKSNEQKKKKIQEEQVIIEYNRRMYEIQQDYKRKELNQSKRAMK